MENVFNTKDDKHCEDDIAEDDEQGMPEVPESHGFEKHGGDFVDGSENEGVEEYPSEIFDSRYRTVDVLEFDVATAVQQMCDMGAEEHHQGASKGGDA
jgi:hypothetical protein